MNRWKKLSSYLLLNVLVSTITIIGVLFVWENTNFLKNALSLPTESTPRAERTEVESPSGISSDQSVIKIIEVIGVDNLPTEHIRIKHVGEDTGQALSLLHWRLRDENGHEFDISAHANLQSLELHSNGAIDIYTKPGPSTPIELYLGLTEPLWSHGETVTLLDEKGNVQDTYIIP